MYNILKNTIMQDDIQFSSINPNPVESSPLNPQSNVIEEVEDCTNPIYKSTHKIKCMFNKNPISMILIIMSSFIIIVLIIMLLLDFSDSKKWGQCTAISGVTGGMNCPGLVRNCNPFI